jgi:hypothetical protein
MNSNQIDFLKLLFEKDEGVCVSHNKYAWLSVPISDLHENKILLVSHREDIDDVPIKTDMINMIAINPVAVGERRMDLNVTAFRSFLVELDYGRLSEQKRYVEDIGMPYSVCVYSGNKSLHFGIVLEDPLPSLSMYKIVSRWILNIMEKADKQTLNPTRSIRFPDNLRRVYGNGVVPLEDRKPQHLVDLKKRITQKELFQWLSNHKDKKPKPERKRERPSGNPSFRKLEKWARDEIADGVPCQKLGGRNKTWYSLAAEMAIVGYSLDDTYSILGEYYSEESDFRESEWSAALKNGYHKGMEKLEGNND